MKNTIYILFISIAFFFACENEIIIDDALLESKLAVSAFISTDSAIVVYVYQSTPLNGLTRSTSKKDAKVTLKYDKQQTELELAAVFNGYNNQMESDSLYYYTMPNLRGIAGKTYQLEVSCPGFETATAETTIPMPVEIISLDTLSMFKSEGMYKKFEQHYKLRFIDPAHEKNYYRLMHKKSEGRWRYTTYFSDTIDFFNILISNGNSYFNSKDPIFSEESDDANSYIFGGAWNSYSVFNDELINGMDYQLNVFQSRWISYGDDGEDEEYIKNEILVNTEIGNFRKETIYLQSISPELFFYLRSIDLQSYNDGAPFMEPVPVYNNINNGYGIFGSYSSTSLEVSWGEYPKEGIEYITYKEAWQKYQEMNPGFFEQ